MPTACLNTSRPSMRRWPTVCGRGRPAIDVELGLVPAVGAQMRGQHAAIGTPCPAAAAPPSRPRRRRRRTARRCCGRSSRECARRSPRRSPARACTMPAAQQASAVATRDRRSRSTPPAGRTPRRDVMPSPACTDTAVAGKVLSGVEVASTIRSIDCASMPASASAARAAVDREIARSTRRRPRYGAARMPVRCTIHSSEVSTLAASSALVRTRSRQIAAAAENHRTQHGHETASARPALRLQRAACRD